MAADFIATTDAGLLDYSRNFFALIDADPEAYGLDAGLAATYGVKQTLFAQCLAAAVDPATRGGAKTLAKDLARADLVAYTRLLAATVRGTIGVTDQQRYALGLSARRSGQSAIQPPASAPHLDILSAIGRTVKILLHDSGSPTRAGKAPGAAGASVYSFIGPNPPANAADWFFQGHTTRARYQITFPDTVANGATIWCTACWYNPRAQPGPTCAPVSANIPGGAAMAA